MNSDPSSSKVLVSRLNRNISSKIKRMKVTKYAALRKQNIMDGRTYACKHEQRENSKPSTNAVCGGINI